MPSTEKNSIATLDANAITTAAELGRSASEAQILHATEERRGVYYLQTPDGVDRKLAEPGWHNESLLSADAIADFAKAFKRERSALFLGEDGIVFVYDTQDRRDRATCDLAHSEPYKALQQAMDGVSQKEFDRLLRIPLKGFVQSTTLLPSIQKVKFSHSTEGGSNVGHGSEGMSLAVQRELTGATAIDEEVQIRLPLFEDVPHEVQVTCAVEIDIDRAKFSLTPLPAQLRTAFDMTFAQIENTLERAEIPIFRGNP